MSASNIISEISSLSNKAYSKAMERYFKTGKGDYGEGDIFVGVKVPNLRMIAKKNKDLSLQEVATLLHSPVHENRLCACYILEYAYPKSKNKEKIIDFYLKNTSFINNWDLVDASAPKLLGQWILHNPSYRSTLHTLASSSLIWDRRIAMLSTFPLIKNAEYDEALNIAKTLLTDSHDLINKAVGWMLREIGKKDEGIEISFIEENYTTMPRMFLSNNTFLPLKSYY